jgi:hypothetical protein
VVAGHWRRIASHRNKITILGQFGFDEKKTSQNQKRGQLLLPPFLYLRYGLAFDYVNDFMCPRTQDDIPPAHQDEIITAPFRVNFDNPCRKRIIVNSARDDRSDGNVEVNVRNLFNLLRLDGGRNLALLFSRGCGCRTFRVSSCSSLSISRGGSPSLLVTG